MVGHDDEGVKLVAALVSVVGQGVEEQICGGFDLEEAAAVCGDGGGEVGAELLRRRERHLGRIKEGPGLKPLFICPLIQGPEGPCSLRVRASREC